MKMTDRLAYGNWRLHKTIYECFPKSTTPEQADQFCAVVKPSLPCIIEGNFKTKDDFLKYMYSELSDVPEEWFPPKYNFELILSYLILERDGIN
jgi:hypothetical protein